LEATQLPEKESLVTPPQDDQATTSVLVVAHRTAATPALLEAVRERAARGPVTFTLLVPNSPKGLHRLIDPEDTDPQSAREVLDRALPALSEAAGAPVEGSVGDANPLSAVMDAVNAGDFDEIIISTLPTSVSRWLRLDLPHKVAGLGLPVTTVTPDAPAGAASGDSGDVAGVGS
jgi:hypothetical protein